MKITETRKIERKIVDLYECSKRKDGSSEAIKAKKKVEKIFLFFELLSVFMGEDHVGVVRKLYFSRDNIFTIGIRRMADKVFIQERTLFLYRQRYCKIIDAFLEEINFEE